MIRIGMGTTSVLPHGVHDAFRLAADAGFDGVEVMVTSDRDTRDSRVISGLSAQFGMPVLSIHAPVLAATAAVFGFSPRAKLDLSVALAREVGAATVVVHPPYRWQPRSAARFEGVVRELQASSGVVIAVENMFPFVVGGYDLKAYAPHWNPGRLAIDALTLDFSHAALAGVSALDLTEQWGDRLRHVHLCDGSTTQPGERLDDEHLVPGRGTQPVAEVLQRLAATGFDGAIVAEISTRACGNDERRRLAWLRETLGFARRHLSPVRA